MTQIRWGILGAGRIAQQFARDIQHAPSATLSMIAARDLGRARAFAETFEIPHAVGSYDALYSGDQVDAIYIATPHSHHLEQGLAAIAAGKAVLCEKPLSVNHADSERLIEAARDANVYLMEAMWTWFLPAIRQAEQWLTDGRIGELVQVKADFGYPMPWDPDGRAWNPDLAGGCLLDMGVYPTAFTWLFTRKPADRLSAIGRLAENGVDADIVWQGDYGTVSASMGTSFRSKLPNLAYLIGTEGWIEIPDFWRAPQARLYKVNDLIETFVDDRAGDGFEFEIEAASQDILAGRTQSERVSHADTLGFQIEMDRIRDAIQPR